MTDFTFLKAHNYTFRSNPDSVSKIKPDFILNAAELVDAFEADESAANSKYLDKIIQLSGTVTEISDDQEEITIVYIKGNLMGNVSCQFSDEVLADQELQVGDQLTVKGKCTGYILDVVLTKCALVAV